jgi:hypothetical protein
MAYVIEVPNPFQPTIGTRKHRVDELLTIREWLEREYPGFVEFPVPTVCFVNGSAMKRSEWSYVINGSDVVQFIYMPEGPFIIIAIVIVAVAIAVTMAFSVKPPKVPGELPASDPVYSVKGQQNEIRLGEPIEVNYGRNRIYPSFASRPYYQYINNDQYQFSLFCIGQGSYDIAALQIGDTDISAYAEVESQIIPPGGTVALFPTNVITSVEAGGQELFAPNQPEYVAPGWVGPFPTNPSGTLAYDIQIDLIFPKGLYFQADNGGIDAVTVTVEWEAQPIDAAGAPTGPFAPLTGSPLTETATTTTPQRITYNSTVAPGRYQVRVRRTDTKNLSYRAGHDVIWEGMRAYIETDQNWGDITLWAVKVRATNNLNSQTQLKFNCIATRKLPIYESGGMSTALFATRSIIWAFVDAFRARYGARLADKFFIWEDLITLDTLYTGRGDHFDWTFRDPITVWDAATAIMRVGRAIPLINGSAVTSRRDTPQDVPVAMFTPENMINDTFEYDIILWQVDEFDSISVEYTEPATGYKQEQVPCILPGGTGDNPERIQFPGIQDRQQAFREGMYLAAVRRYLRQNTKFSTGHEGYIPSYGDLVAVAHDTPRWGQSGFVVDAIRESGSEYVVYTSEPIRFEESGTHQMLFRGRHGEVLGPYTVYPTSSPMQVIINIPESGDFDFLLGGANEPMLYVFGIAGNVTKYAKVVGIEPQGGETINMTLINDAPVIHSFDGLAAPTLAETPRPPKAPDAPTVGTIYVHQTQPSAQIVQLSWTASFGAQYYVVQTSEDGALWQSRVTTVRTSLQIQARPGPFWVRVAAVNTGQGPWTVKNVNLTAILGIDLLIPWDDLEWKIGWFPVVDATGYQIKFFTNDTAHTLIGTKNVDTPYNDETYAQALLDGIEGHRDLDVQVDVLYGVTPSGAPISYKLHNAVPTPVTGLSAAFVSTESGGNLFRLSWTVPHLKDLHKIKIWVSDHPGFNPATTTPYAQETDSPIGWEWIPTSVLVFLPFDSSMGTWDHYWRIGIFDVWGDEISTNVTAQQTIPHHP